VESGRVLELLAGARSGDAAAWDELYRRVAGWVRAVAYGLGREDTLDVAGSVGKAAGTCRAARIPRRAR